jgi:glycine cleavage system regulatory protein
MVLTAIARDRPGVVESLADLITAHLGNWVESSMAQLGGEFAGNVMVECRQGLSTNLRTPCPPSTMRVLMSPCTRLLHTRHQADTMPGLSLPASLGLDDLRNTLEQIATDIMVDIELTDV